MKIIDEPNLERLKKEIKKTGREIAVRAKDDNYNRKALEHGGFDVLLSPEAGDRRDKLRNLDSGLNHVLAKIARSNKVAVGIDLESIRELGKRDKAIRMGRVRRNLVICRKAGVRVKVIGDADRKNVFSLLISLGASTSQAIQAI